MTTIAELAETMQTLLTTTADELAQKTGFIQRKRKVSGAGFAQALAFGFMANPAATREEVNQAAASAGMELSTPGLDKRFSAKAAYFLDGLLAKAVEQVISNVPQAQSVLSQFNGVFIGDGSVVALPEALASVFRGNNGADDAAVKLAVQWDIQGGDLALWLSDATVHDQRTGIINRCLPAGALRLNDLGFFNLETFAQDDAQGVFFLSRYKGGTLVYHPDGSPLELVRYLQQQGDAPLALDILLGKERLPCRLIALPVAPEQVGKRRNHLQQTASRKQQPVSARALALAAWTLYVTNVPALAPEAVAVLGCTRWQIECLFKLWKGVGLLDQTRSHDPYRVWCELYAKLLALLVQHWLMLLGCWQRLNRSLHRAAQLIHKYAFALVAVLSDLTRLVPVLQQVVQVMAQTCGLSKRAAHPLTFQRWLEVAHA